MIFSKQFVFPSEGRFHVILLTDKVVDFVQECGISNGQVIVFFQHTTGSIIIDEYETGILADLKDMFERITPTEYAYKHHIREVDFNGHAHLRSALMQASVTIPIIDGKLALGTYQDIILIDDQVEQEPRFVFVQVNGE